MPPKSCVCSICNENVLKSQTYQLLNGTRACKKHEGVIESANNLKEQNKQKAQEDIKRKEEKKRYREEKYNINEMEKNAIGRCWSCKKDGLIYEKYLERVIISMQKAEIQKEHFNIFDPFSYIQKYTGDVVPLFRMIIEERHIRDIHFTMKETSRLGKIAVLCPECVKKMELEKEFKDIYQKQNNIDISLVDLLMLSDIISKPYKKIAQEELDNDKI